VATAQASVVVSIDPDAGGVDPTINVGSLDWAVGNSIAVGGVPSLAGNFLDVFAHANLASFQDADGNPIGGLNLNGPVAGTNYEWTFVSSFREQISSVVGALPNQTTNTVVVADPNNVLQIWYDPVRNSNNLPGTGFNNGTLILEATDAFGSGTFTTSGIGANLDAFGVNNYPGYTTVSGNGSTTISAHVTFFDPTFFTSFNLGDVITVDFTTQQVLNYQQQNPSSCFFDPNAGAFFSGAGNGIAGGCGVAGDGGTIGLVNGITGPNVMFQTDASASFNAVPEPGTLALLGAALLGFAAVSRRRKGE
jgi:hypothetical protein